MAVPGFFAQELANPHVECPTLGAGMPSPIQRFTISMWVCNATSAGFTVEGPLHSGFSRSILQFLFSSGGVTGATVQALLDFYAVNHDTGAIVDGGSGAMYELSGDVNYYDQVTSDGLTEWTGSGLIHFLATVDFVAQTVACYANDQPLSENTGNIWHSATAPNATLEVPWQLYGSNIPGGNGVADVWMNPTVLDISDVAVRRQFINADLSAVALPSDGHITVGGSTVTPVVFLHALSSGSPSDFAVNNGTGPTWSVFSGSLAFQPEPGSCVFSTSIGDGGPLPPSPSLAMDNVLAIDQTPAVVAGSQIFLKWSDDRAHTWGSPVGQPIGAKGAYLTSAQWQRLGYSRDRVFSVEWSVPVATALLGAYIEVDSSAKS